MWPRLAIAEQGAIGHVGAAPPLTLATHGEAQPGHGDTYVPDMSAEEEDRCPFTQAEDAIDAAKDDALTGSLRHLPPRPACRHVHNTPQSGRA